jgi:hypothetical protein
MKMKEGNDSMKHNEMNQIKKKTRNLTLSLLNLIKKFDEKESRRRI